MQVLIVHAHHESKSFTAAMRDMAVEEFTRRGDGVTISDLYALNFDPVARNSDFGDPTNRDYIVYALEQRHGYANGTLAPDILAEVEKLQRADLLILSFPVFWFSVPAIMKGWIDRVLLSGVTFGGRRFYDKGGLKGKRALVAASIGGREHMFGEGAIHGQLEGLLSHVLRGTLGYVGMDVLPPFIAWHIPYISPAERGAMIERYREYLRKLDMLQPLAMPKLDDFDATMRPQRK